MISSHLYRAKKIQSVAKQFKKLFSPNHFRWNGIVAFQGLNMLIFSISALDRSSKVLSWVGSWFPISSAIPFSHHFFQTDIHKAVQIVAKNGLGICEVSLIADQSECLVCYFLCTGLTLFCTELTALCTELPENCIYVNQSELSIFFHVCY